MKRRYDGNENIYVPKGAGVGVVPKADVAGVAPNPVVPAVGVVPNSPEEGAGAEPKALLD